MTQTPKEARKRLKAIRARASYDLFAKVAAQLLKPPNIEQTLLLLHAQMDRVKAFRSTRNSEFALESLRQVLADIGMREQQKERVFALVTKHRVWFQDQLTMTNPAEMPDNERELLEGILANTD